jgi:probable phosphoglycerate mutase
MPEPFRAAAPFYMVRHGETDWNREGRFQGHSEIPLNDRGRRQALANGCRLGREHDDWRAWDFVASPLGRARETMELLREAMGLPTADYATETDLMEVSYGDWERHSIDELRRDRIAEFEARELDRWNFQPLGGDSYASIVGRVRRTLETLPGPSVLVTHGGVLRVTRHLLEGLAGQDVAGSAIPQDQIYHWDGTRVAWLS